MNETSGWPARNKQQVALLLHRVVSYARQWIPIALRAALVIGLLSLIQPPRLLVTLGEPQTVVTRNELAGVHTLFVNEVEEWKIQRGLSMIREMGAPWIVEFLPWAYMEPRKGQYNWESAERIVRHANQQGLRLIARLGFVPDWARPDPIVQQTTTTYLDRDRYEDFAEFAAAFAAHFRGRIDHIIIWNEPNLSIEWGMRPVDAAGYIEMLRAVYPAIKQANPDVTVLAGALAPTLEPPGSAQGLNDLLYLEAMYEALNAPASSSGQHAQPKSLRRPYDAWAVHTYGRTAPHDEPPAADRINFRRVELLREIMARNGDDAPVYITESGWNDDPRWVFAVTPAQRIAYTLGAWEYARVNWPWVRCVAVWVFKHPAPAYNYRDRYTFVTPSLEPLPIYEEVKKALAD
ncbi:MAG: cellulase family glycosylhydrolase [Anaerolineae bacterium]|nr:cellulase family glycosylhydrolase [Thermoflexales bacterium]MDW8406286.1 cellulase family glycosylhydrolase [Anaerolineae bacterium]